MARPRLISDEEILGTVRSAVLDDGPRVSLDIVADRLGVTAPALFKRFGSRNALLLAALAPSRPDFLDLLAGGPDGRPFAKQLEELFESIAGWCRAAVPCMVALKGSGISFEEVHTALGEAPPVVVSRTLAAWLQRAHRAGLAHVSDSETTSVAMMGALHTRAFLSHLLRKPASPRELAEDAKRFTKLFVEGLSPHLPNAKRKSRPTTTSKKR